MTDQEKKDYNKQHYRKNRPIILEKMRTRYEAKRKVPGNIISLFGMTKPESSQVPEGTKPTGYSDQKKRFFKSFFEKLLRVRIGTVFLLVLASANSSFLLTEMAHFYASTETLGNTPGIGSVPAGYLKAFLLEGDALALCLFIKARQPIAKVVHLLFIALIYAYSIWVLSGLAFQAAFSSQSQTVLFQKKTAELELEISKKVALRDSYFHENRVTLGSKLDQQLEELKKSLDRSRESLSRSPTIGMIWNSLITVVAFRILIMISNLLCMRELGRRYRIATKTV